MSKRIVGELIPCQIEIHIGICIPLVNVVILVINTIVTLSTSIVRMTGPPISPRCVSPNSCNLTSNLKCRFPHIHPTCITRSVGGGPLVMGAYSCSTLKNLWSVCIGAVEAMNTRLGTVVVQTYTPIVVAFVTRRVLCNLQCGYGPLCRCIAKAILPKASF